jgi:hypothetical protein
MVPYLTRNWYGLYSQGWGNDLVPEAYCHPAKVRPALARKIYEHAIERGWLERGSVVIDPFAGIAGFALSAMRFGMHFVGVELEDRFIQLGRQNIELWNKKYSALPGWGSAVLLQGDSRELGRVVGEAGAVVSSPPYADGCTHTGGDDPRPEFIKGGEYRGVGIAGAISSPPYAESLASDDPDKRGGLYRDPKRRNDKTLTAEYGQSDGQLAQMPPGEFDGIVSSPPWESQEAAHSAKKFRNPVASAKTRSDGYRTGRLSGHYASPEAILRSMEKANDQTYGDSEGQLGQASGDTFWSASRTIIEQVYQVLRPAAVAIWVCKRFVRGGEIVEFSQQWMQLCESIGFETIEWIKAWLVEDRGAQYTLDGSLEQRQVKRFSFFRRLHAQKYPHLAIEWEDVICLRKPLGGRS